MKKSFLSICLFVLTVCLPAQAAVEKSLEEPGTVTFVPPKNWRMVDAKQLKGNVRFMVIGKGKYEFPPSINLSTEEYKGTLREYLAIVKEINSSQGSEWKNLGMIKTEAGDASLSQADAITEWGPIRMMHVILLRDDVIYILTAASLKKEFPTLYQTFFKSFKSLKITNIAPHH
ncbi:putative secreted protein [Waddlia chondrophila 2032/99]|uniref:Putative secreted protein n=1 Tax=Waddlia chondrophila 2032/99 TaxID=765953 RepID=F8LEH1_9BACT|nr:putative secreted protein [Waddlia chondrophila 2032/99]